MCEIFPLSRVLCRISHTDDAWEFCVCLVPSAFDEHLLISSGMAVDIAVRLHRGKRQLVRRNAYDIALEWISVS